MIYFKEIYDEIKNIQGKCDNSTIPKSGFQGHQAIRPLRKRYWCWKLVGKHNTGLIFIIIIIFKHTDSPKKIHTLRINMYTALNKYVMFGSSDF